MIDGGLTADQVAERRATFGPNVLPPARSVPVWRQILAQFVHFFALLLWLAAGLAVLGGVVELALAIVAVVVINGVFAFVQEHRAERAAERLRDLVPRRVLVVRDGRRTEIDADDLVPGDLVVLVAGSRISADLDVSEGHSLLADESVLTGESVPVPVDAGGRLRAGTFLVEGEGTARVVTIGSETEFGQLARLTQSVDRPATPLARELQRLVRTVAVIALGTGVVFFGVMVAGLGIEPSDGFVFAVGITVALVPEGLLPTVTLALSVGAQRMAHRNALVRRLESVETLGSTTFICTDKTGTLTENRMNVVAVWSPAGEVTVAGHGYEPTATVTGDGTAMAAAALVAASALACSTGRIVDDDGRWVAHGDPVEAAIDALARRLDGVVAAEVPVDRRFPFDARRRRSSAVAGRAVSVKGAPDAVLPVCRSGPESSGAAAAVDELARRGLRVLAVARRDLAEGEVVSSVDDAEHDLELVGLVALSDPPRTGVRQAIERCRGAGIGVAMVTGDHHLTAVSVAEAVGLSVPGSPVLSGADLPADDAALAELIDHDGVVICRVNPADKLRIARALQSRGHVVAMTGDGVNDGPALREADIGVAMGRSGTDVAREAADLVLLDDDFSTIVAAVEQGRATFSNARQFLTYHLTDNVAELSPFVLWAMTGGRFPLALGILQILALDLGTDTLSAAALGAETPAEDTLRQPPSSGRLLDRRVARRSFGVLGPTEALFGIAAFLAVLWSSGWRPADGFPDSLDTASASGATFATVVLAQTANAFACRRSTAPAWRAPAFGNRLLIGAVLIELAFAGVMLGVPVFAEVLGHGLPNAAGWAVALVSMPAVLVVDALVKRGASGGRARS